MSQDLGGQLSRYLNWVYSTLEARFYNCGELCRVASAARG